MARINNWPAALTLFLREKEAAPFAWGKNDCCLFGADWTAIVVRIDPAADLRGKYDSAIAAARLMEEADGLRQLVAQRCAQHGWAEIKPTLARRGDLVLFDGAAGLTLGVCVGRMVAGPTETGVGYRPMTEAIAAWRIG